MRRTRAPGMAVAPTTEGFPRPEEIPVLSRKIRQWVAGLVFALLAIAGIDGMAAPPTPQAQSEEKPEELSRKPKVKVAPIYPDLARRMNIRGTVRLAVVVAPNGSVKSSKAIGGHPLLVTAAVDAVKRWKFEPAAMESTGVVEVRFDPQD